MRSGNTADSLYLKREDYLILHEASPILSSYMLFHCHQNFWDIQAWKRNPMETQFDIGTEYGPWATKKNRDPWHSQRKFCHLFRRKNKTGSTNRDPISEKGPYRNLVPKIGTLFVRVLFGWITIAMCFCLPCLQECFYSCSSSRTLLPCSVSLPRLLNHPCPPVIRID